MTVRGKGLMSVYVTHASEVGRARHARIKGENE
jgi:hypothetical protein